MNQTSNIKETEAQNNEFRVMYFKTHKRTCVMCGIRVNGLNNHIINNQCDKCSRSTFGL